MLNPDALAADIVRYTQEALAAEPPQPNLAVQQETSGEVGLTQNGTKQPTVDETTLRVIAAGVAKAVCDALAAARVKSTVLVTGIQPGLNNQELTAEGTIE